MILREPILCDGLAPFALKVDRGGVEEDDVHAAEQVPAQVEKHFLDLILDAPGRKRRRDPCNGLPRIFSGSWLRLPPQARTGRDTRTVRPSLISKRQDRTEALDKERCL